MSALANPTSILDAVAAPSVEMQPSAEFLPQTRTIDPPIDRGAQGIPPWIARQLPEQEHQQWAQQRAATKNWLLRWLHPDPPDPRRAPRLTLPFLDAYFFTGGKPEPHRIRDISATGVYVLTDVRWYVGTVVRITLADRRRPTEDRSFTVQAKVVRCGADGVGFHFLLEDDNEPGYQALGSAHAPVAGVRRAQVESFLERVRSSGLN